MKTLKLAYQKLSNKSSNVSAHYLITRKGVIFNLLCPKYKAWHAGKSKWKNNVNINDYSKKQYDSLKSLIFFLKKNFYILNKDIIFHSDIAPNRKEDPGERFFINKIGINRFNNKKTKKNTL